MSQNDRTFLLYVAELCICVISEKSRQTTSFLEVLLGFIWSPVAITLRESLRTRRKL